MSIRSHLRAITIALSLIGATVVVAPPHVEAAAKCVFPHDARAAQRNWPNRMSSLVGTKIRTGRHQCFERVVIEMGGSGQMPGFRVAYQKDPVKLSPSDQTVYIRGAATLVISMAVWMPDTEGRGYSGRTRLFPSNVVHIKELRQIENFEGYNQWAVGLDRTRPFRVFTLTAPPRLVVDIGN